MCFRCGNSGDHLVELLTSLNQFHFLFVRKYTWVQTADSYLGLEHRKVIHGNSTYICRRRLVEYPLLCGNPSLSAPERQPRPASARVTDGLTCQAYVFGGRRLFYDLWCLSDLQYLARPWAWRTKSIYQLP